MKGEVTRKEKGICMVTWDGIFNTIAEIENPTGDLAVGFFVALPEDLDGTIHIIPDTTSKIMTKFESEQSLFMQDSLVAVSISDTAVKLNSRIHRNRYTDSDCNFPENITFILPGCELVSTDVEFTNRLTSEGNRSAYSYIMDQAEIVRCASAIRPVNEISFQYLH